MQINKIGNNQNFGAIPDIGVRNILLRLKNNNIDTENIMHLIRDNFGDKFIMHNFNLPADGLMRIGLYDRRGNYATLIKEILRFDPQLMIKKPALFAKFFTKKLTALAQMQSREQGYISNIENFFGRYPNERAYLNMPSYGKHPFKTSTVD